MRRRFAALWAILLVLATLAPAVMASVPRVLVIEEFGATW